MAGTRLKLTYDRPLHPEGRPAEDAFELHYPLESDETDEDRRTVNHSIGSRLVQGNKMVLHLASPWFPCSGATPFTVSYTKPTDADALKLKASRRGGGGRVQAAAREQRAGAPVRDGLAGQCDHRQRHPQGQAAVCDGGGAAGGMVQG